MNKNKGFTLVEMLITVAIIGILASIVLVNMNRQKMRTRDTIRVEDVKSIAQVTEAFFVENGYFPANLTEIDSFIKIPLTDPLKRSYSYTYYSATKTYCIGARLEISRTSPSSCITGVGNNYRIDRP